MSYPSNRPPVTGRFRGYGRHQWLNEYRACRARGLDLQDALLAVTHTPREIRFASLVAASGFGNECGDGLQD